jgi:hypothetical protein
MISNAKFSRKPRSSRVRFSVTADAAWAPGVETREAWQAWARSSFPITSGSEPAVDAMPAMQRRRASFLGRMALEVAYKCLGERAEIPAIFCSRHGEVSRSVDLLRDLASGAPLSPTSFGLSVHNAIGGMFSIARSDMGNSMAISAREASVEHAVIEACGLLADGEKSVLLVVYDCPLPAIYANYQSDGEQPFAWAWLIEPPQQDVISLVWSVTPEVGPSPVVDLPDGLQILRFYLQKDCNMERVCETQKWQWSRHA